MAFSIRDYTLKMRTINAFECWPFEEENLTHDEINGQLPPMKVPKQSKCGRNRRRMKQRKLKKSKKSAAVVDGVSPSEEKLLSRKNLRRRTLAEIFDRKEDDEKHQPPPPPPQPPMTTNLLMLPPLPRSPKILPPSDVVAISAAQKLQIEKTLDVIVIDDEDDEDSELVVSNFRRSKPRLEAMKLNEGKLISMKEEEESEVVTVAPDISSAGDSKKDMEGNAEEFTELEENAAKRESQNPVINGSRRFKDTTGNETANLEDSDASGHEKNLCSKNITEEKKEKENLCDFVGKQQKADALENHCHVHVPPSNVLASSLEKDKFSGIDEGAENLQGNTNDENLAIKTYKRKEVCPKVENKQFSIATEQAAMQNFLKPSANQEKSQHLVKESKSLSKASSRDVNLIQFDKGTMSRLHFPQKVDVARPLSAFQEGNIFTFQSAAVNPNANSRKIIEPNANMTDKSRFLSGKEKEGVRNNIMEQNLNGISLNSNGKLIDFSSRGRVEMNKPESSSKLRDSFSCLSVNNSSHQENLSIGERNVAQNKNQNRVQQDLFNPDSELKHINNIFIEQNKQKMIPPKVRPGLISQCSSQQPLNLMVRDVQIGSSSQERQKQQFVRGDFRVPEESTRRHYSEECDKHKSYSGSQLQISSNNVYQPLKLHNHQTLQSNLLMKGPNSNFLHCNHPSQNQSLGVIRNASSNSNFPEQFIAKPNPPQGLIFPNNGDINDRKRNHFDTSSSFGAPFSSQPPPWFLSQKHERLPSGLTPNNTLPQNTWNHNFSNPSPNHYTIVQPILQVTHVTNSVPRNLIQTTTVENHSLSNSRKRQGADFIDLTKPNKLPNKGSNLECNTREVEMGTSVGGRCNHCYHNETQNLNPRTHLRFDSFHPNEEVMHSQNVDQENSRRSVPTAATSDSDSDLELQRKLTKTYINNW